MAGSSGSYWDKYDYADSPGDVQSERAYTNNVRPEKSNDISPPPPGAYRSVEGTPDSDPQDLEARWAKYGYAEEPAPPAPEEPPPPEEPTAGDYGRVAMGGLAQTGGMVAGLGEYVANMVGADKAKEFLGGIRKAADDATEYWHSGLSAAGKRDLEKKYATTGEDAAWKDLDSILFTIIASAPSTVVTLGPAGKAAQVAYKAAFAKTAGTLAAKKAAATKAAAKAATVAGAAGEGALGAGGIAADITKTLEEMKPEDLRKLEEYQRIKAENPNMSEEDIRKGIIAAATRWNAAIGGVLTGAIGAVAGPMEARLFTGEAGNILSRFGRGAVVEGAQEGLQAPAETIPTNIALEQPLTEGLLENTLASIVGGAGMGGPMAALGGKSSPESLQGDGAAPPPGTSPMGDLAGAPDVGQVEDTVGTPPPGASGATVQSLQDEARAAVAAEGGDLLQQEMAAAEVGIGAGQAQDASRARVLAMQKKVDEETAYADTQIKEDVARQKIQHEAEKRYVAGLKSIQEEAVTEAKKFELAEKIRETENKILDEKEAAQAMQVTTAQEKAAKQARVNRANEQWNALLAKREELGLAPAAPKAVIKETRPPSEPQPVARNAMQEAFLKATDKLPKAEPAPAVEERIPEVGAFAPVGQKPESPVRRSKEVIRSKGPKKGRLNRRNLYRLDDEQQAINEQIQTSAPADVREELDYIMEGYEPETGDQGNYKLALEDAIDIAESEKNTKFLKKIRPLAIQVGMYREITDEELSRTMTNKGKAFDFVLGGKKYTYNSEYKTEMQRSAEEDMAPMEAEPLEQGTKVRYRLGDEGNSTNLSGRLQKDGDGFTVDNATGKDIDTGYAVGMGKERKIPGIATPEDIEKYRQDHADILSQPDHKLGGWVWEGNTYLDVSKIFPDDMAGRSGAVKLGKSNKEIAVMRLGKDGGMLMMDNYSSQGDIYFNEKALENAKKQNYLSRETLVHMSPDDFLNMAEHLKFPDEQKAREVTMVLDKFNTPFDSLPHLSFENNGDGTATVVGHEGRHRAMELKRRGVKDMPVVLLSTEGGKGEAIRWQRWIEEGKPLPRTLINQNKRGSMPFPVGQKGKNLYRLEDEKDGRDFKNFFSAVTKGMTGTSSTGAEYTPVVESVLDALSKPRSSVTRFAKEYSKHRGNFDDHIAFSIPGFKDVQQLVGSALSRVYGKDHEMLDIGASEGSFVKAVTALSGMKTVALDPNPDMRDSFQNTSTVKGSEYSMTALGTAEQEGTFAWKEGEEDILFFDPAGQRYDVVHEAMVFQFISNERSPQIARVKELMKPGGVFITEEKLFTDNQAENEAKKNKYKGQFFEKKDLDAKSAEVLEGMHANMVEDKQLEAILQSNFTYVTQFWDSGNFKGYMASDSKANLDKLVKATGSTKSEYSTVDTPRALPVINPALDEFLKDSVVKHVVYHGTNTEDITKFKTPAYFTDEPGFAYRFTNRTGTENIMPVVINITNPYRINGNVEGRHFEWTRSEIKEMKAKGYDGVIIETAGEADIYTVFNPTQVKSAVGNVGTYNAKSANILLRQGNAQTENPLFKKWFGNSKVVNEDGTPMVVYRGEYDVGDRAGQIQTKTGTPTFTDAPGVASVYAMDPNAYMDKARATGAHVIPAYISMQNPIDLRGGYEESVVTLGQLRDTFKGSEAELYKILRQAADFRIDGEMVEGDIDFETADGDIYTDTYKVFDEAGIVELAKKHGYDGFIYWGGFTGTFELHEQGLSRKNIRETEEVTLEIRPFSQSQIKSAVGNVGTFDAENIDILLRKGNAGGGVSVGEAMKVLDPVLAKMDRLEANILNHPGEAPADLSSRMKRDGALGAKGVFDPDTGKLYVFTNNHRNVGDVIKTLLHEGVAHKGLRLLYPNEQEFNALRDELYSNIVDQKGLKAIANKYRLDLTKIEDQRIAAEEYVASKAESEVELGVVRIALASIRGALRRLGIVNKWTDTDVLALLRSSRRNLQGVPLSKVMITTEVEIEGTGEIVEIEEPADRVLRQLDKRRAMCDKLRTCLG